MSIITEVFVNKDKTLVHQYERTTRFSVRGSKMYVKAFEDVVDVLSKSELKMLLRIMDDTDSINRFNVIVVPFDKVTPDIDRTKRSKFKRKLLDNGIMQEYKGKLIISPFILLPRGSKDVRNSQYLTQRAWVYLFVDKDKYVDGIDEFIRTCWVD